MAHWPAVRRSGAAASVFVVLALIALLVVPRLIERGGVQARREIEGAGDPARTLVTEIQYLLARQTSSLRGYLLSGDTSILYRFEQFAEQEERVYTRLRPLVDRLGPEARARFDDLRDISAHWHTQLRGELTTPQAAVLSLGALPFSEEIYLEALAAASELDNAILSAMAERRDVILTAQRLSNWTQGFLAMVALAAALTAAGLGLRVYGLAAVAEARRREAELALADTAAAVESKARLVRGVTHDVKNPLGAADAYADLLALGIKGELTGPQAAVVAGIRRSIRHALTILQDLLDLSRAESGALSIEREFTLLSTLVDGVVDDYRGAVEAAGQSIELRLPADRVVVFTDEGRVRQILGNLISNAVKYTPQAGRISVEVVPEAEGEVPRPGRWVVVRVADAGPGIRVEDQERIFQEFERLPGTAAGGHGLGLTISRRIARLLGGEVIVESSLGSGSTFSLLLPVRSDAPADRV